MNATILLLMLSGLSLWLAIKRPSTSTVLAAVIIGLLTSGKALGMHLVMGAWLTEQLSLRGAAGLSARQLGKLQVEILCALPMLALAGIAVLTGRRRLSRRAGLLASVLLAGWLAGAGIDALGAATARTPEAVAAFALVEGGVEAYSTLAVLMAWIILCVRPAVQVERWRRSATTSYPIYG